MGFLKVFGRAPLEPNQIQGFVFDGATFLANFIWLDFYLATPVDDVADRTLALLLATGVTAQFLDGFLKKGSPQDRLQARFVDLKVSNGSREFVWVAISTVVAALTSGTVWLAIGHPSEEKLPPAYWPYQELLANVLLWISATILTRFLWDALLLETGPPTYMGFTPQAFLLAPRRC